MAYFNQYREQLDPEQTVVDNVGEGKQEVMVRGRSRHILGYLQDFLFEPKRPVPRSRRSLVVRRTGCCWPSCSSSPATC